MPGLSGFLSGRLVDENSGKCLIENEFQEEIVTRLFCNDRFISQVLRDTLS